MNTKNFRWEENVSPINIQIIQHFQNILDTEGVFLRDVGF